MFPKHCDVRKVTNEKIKPPLNLNLVINAQIDDLCIHFAKGQESVSIYNLE